MVSARRLWPESILQPFREGGDRLRETIFQSSLLREVREGR